VLVDADMRLPRVHSVFGLTLSPGLAELIRGDVSLEEALRRPCDGRFDVITAGRVPPNPSELLASPDFAVLLARLKAAYDLVLIDSPVLLGVSDSYILGAQTDGMLLIHRPGSVAIRGLEDLRVQLSRAGARLVGIAFNQVDRNDRHFYPQYLESPYVSKGRAAGRRLPAKRRLK
jgi:capsular exopolysaccharide synthesis family protein